MIERHIYNQSKLLFPRYIFQYLCASLESVLFEMFYRKCLVIRKVLGGWLEINVIKTNESLHTWGEASPK